MKRLLGRASGVVIAFVRLMLRSILRAAAIVELVLVGLLAAVGRPASAAVVGLDRALTPVRGATIVAIAAFVVLSFAQFDDYRGIAIGHSQYEDVAPLTSAPMAETWTGWSSHGPAVLLLGLIAVGATLVALYGTRARGSDSGVSRTRSGGGTASGPSRWRGPRAAVANPVALIASAGAVFVVLAIDLPKVGDVGELGDLYANAEGVILGGFYTQLAGATVLLGVALLPLVWKLERRGGKG